MNVTVVFESTGKEAEIQGDVSGAVGGASPCTCGHLGGATACPETFKAVAEPSEQPSEHIA